MEWTRWTTTDKDFFLTYYINRFMFLAHVVSCGAIAWLPNCNVTVAGTTPTSANFLFSYSMSPILRSWFEAHKGKSARIADVKKWGSRFGSDLNNESRYWSKILIWCFWIIQLSKSIQFVKIGQWTSEKFRFQVRKRKKEIHAKRDFFPSSCKPCSFLNSSLDLSISCVQLKPQ